MPDFKPKPGSFAPYLEYAQRDQQPGQPSTASPLTLLATLAGRVPQNYPLCDLLKLSGMDLSRYHDTLKSLRDAGYVTVEGPPLDEVVCLTEKGAEAARLARPS